MAGIGFELQRVLRRGGIGSFVRVALSGMMIVAGPWLLSIVAIFVIGRYAGIALAEGRMLFMGVIIYSYAFSLFLLGGVHYIFTRLISDLIYLKRSREAASTLLAFGAALAAAAGAVAAAALWRLPAAGVSHPLLFKVSSGLFFAVINLIWLLMIFISLLKRFMAIFLVFLGGMLISVTGVALVGPRLGLGGAMLGFLSGQAFIAVSLLVLSMRDYPPGRLPLRELASYFPRYGFLLLSGLLYYWGIWIDKMIFWAAYGQQVPGTFIHLFDRYDIPVYLANLTMIPGLVYFVVVTETGFYGALRSFLRALVEEPLDALMARKRVLVRRAWTGLRDQGLFQGVLTAAFLLLAPTISQVLFGGSVDPLVLRVAMLAVLFQLLFLTLVTFLFYFELYRRSALACAAYFTVNLACALATVLSGRPLFGASYLAAGVAGSVVAAVLLGRAVGVAERLLLARFR